MKSICILWIVQLPAVNVDVWMCEQQLDDIDVTLLGREVERGPAVLSLDIHLHRSYLGKNSFQHLSLSLSHSFSLSLSFSLILSLSRSLSLSRYLSLSLSLSFST